MKKDISAGNRKHILQTFHRKNTRKKYSGNAKHMIKIMFSYSRQH
jgi:hypothetical protein